jgi:hypothetical protein
LLQALIWADGEAKDKDTMLRLLRSKSELQRSVACLLELRHRLKIKVRKEASNLPK